jgi:hypothetical protein
MMCGTCDKRGFLSQCNDIKGDERELIFISELLYDQKILFGCAWWID